MDKIKIDFHVHTNASSDSLIKPRELAEKSKKTGIIPAITDHDTLEGCKKMREFGVDFIQGCEIRTLQGDLIGLFINEEIPKKLDVEETADRIREQGGLIYMPHMYDTTRKGCGGAYAALADIIEVFNGRCLGRFNDLAKETAIRLKKPMAAGSDSHFLFEFGQTYTEIEYFDKDDPKQLLKALKKANIVGKSAPFYVRGPTWLLSKTRKVLRKIGLTR